MKRILKVTAFVIACVMGLLVVAVNDNQEVFIESKESKTTTGGAVFNKIKWFQFKDKDVWMMNQREGLNEKPFKVSCFMCHNNGPRVIRPNYDSAFDPTGLKDKLKISYWNLRIKLDGRVLGSPTHDDRDQSQLPPFRFRSSYENEPLQVATCIKCHKESGFLARGLLR